MHSVGERANAVDHLLRAPLCAASRAAYRSYLADLYGFVATTEQAVASHGELGRRRAHASWLAGEIHALGASVDELAEIRATAGRAIARVPETRIEALGWLFVVERMVLPVPAVRRRIQRVRADELGPAGDIPTDPQLRFGIGDVAHQLDLVVASNRDMAVLRAAIVAALDSLEDWVLTTAAATANVDVARVRFI